MRRRSVIVQGAVPTEGPHGSLRGFNGMLLPGKSLRGGVGWIEEFRRIRCVVVSEEWLVSREGERRSRF